MRKGGGTVKQLIRRIHRNQKGFTLVELLIVIAILGVLAAVVLLNVTGLIGEGETEASATELVTVQTAMDVMMTKNGLSTVTATSKTNNMAAFPKGKPLYPNYLRTKTTDSKYACNKYGKVTQY